MIKWLRVDVSLPGGEARDGVYARTAKGSYAIVEQANGEYVACFEPKASPWGTATFGSLREAIQFLEAKEGPVNLSLGI